MTKKKTIKKLTRKKKGKVKKLPGCYPWKDYKTMVEAIKEEYKELEEVLNKVRYELKVEKGCRKDADERWKTWMNNSNAFEHELVNMKEDLNIMRRCAELRGNQVIALEAAFTTMRTVQDTTFLRNEFEKNLEIQQRLQILGSKKTTWTQHTFEEEEGKQVHEYRVNING